MAASPDPVAKVSTPGTPLTVSDRRAVRRIPVDTAIVVDQVNPKKPSTQSFDRYEAYKSATTVGGYLEKTSKGWSDFAYDFERGYISMPATAIMAVLPTFLVLALDAGSGFLSSDWAPVPVPLPPPDQPLTFAVSFAGSAHPFHVSAVLRDMDGDRDYSDYNHSIGFVGHDLHRPVVQPLPPSLLGSVDCIPPSLSAYAPVGFSV